MGRRPTPAPQWILIWGTTVMHLTTPPTPGFFLKTHPLIFFNGIALPLVDQGRATEKSEGPFGFARGRDSLERSCYAIMYESRSLVEGPNKFADPHNQFLDAPSGL